VKVITAISFSPDGKWIVTGGQDNTARIWDAEKGTELIVLKGHTHMLMDAKFSPDGKRLITASWDKTARIWDLQRFLDAARAEEEVIPPPPK
jgi:WD40 repeat protein